MVSPKKLIAIIILYKNTKAIVRSLDGNTAFSALQGDTLAPFQFIIFLVYMLLKSIDQMKENDLILKKSQKK